MIHQQRRTHWLWFVSVVVLLNVAALAATGYLVNQSLDRSAANARRIDMNAYSLCRARNISIDRLNRLYDGLADIERHNPYVATSPATVQHRIDLYTAAHLDTFDCGAKP